MKNLNEFKDFIKYKQLNEAEKTTSSGNYNGGEDTFFANVKGNLAGAENTLVGSAVIKLIGFVRRKGMEVYMKSILKPRLGRIIMNGVLRYAIKSNFTGPSKMEFFVIKKVEHNDYVEFNNRVQFKNGDESGLSQFKIGSEVITEQPEPQLIDGQYSLNINDTLFNVVSGKITAISGLVSGTTNQPEVEISVPDDVEIKKQKDEFEEQLKEEVVEPSEDIVKEIESMRQIIDDIKKDTDELGLTDEHENMLLKWQEKIINEINILKKQGIDVIDEKLISKSILDKLGLLKDRAQYIADVNALIQMRDEISVVLNKKHVNVNEAVTVTNKVIKPNKPAVSRLSDELKAYAENGDAIDLNDPKFYKQFDNEFAKKSATKEILTDKSSLIKIQLTAENLIASGNSDKNRWKLKNYWERTVEDVLSLYGKYVITDFVNPYKIIKETSEDVRKKLESENKLIGNLQKTVNSVIDVDRASMNKLFNDSTTLIKELKQIDKNDYCILNLSFTNVESAYYILKRYTASKDDLKVYRLISKIDFTKISKDFNEKDFTTLVSSKFNQMLLPEINEKGLDGNFKGLRGVYIVSDTRSNFSTGKAVNKVSLVYLMSDSEKIDWNDKNSYYFKIKIFRNPPRERILDESFNEPSKNEREYYKIDMLIDETSKYKIGNIESFGKFDDFDIMNRKTIFDAYSTYFKIK